MLSTTEYLVALANQNDIAWTDVDCTATTSPKTIAVILSIRCSDSGGTGFEYVGVRPNGSTETDKITRAYAGGDAGDENQNDCICGVDNSQIFEYMLEASGAGTGNVYIYLVGYIEKVGYD